MIPFAPSQPDSPRETPVCDWHWCYENPKYAAAEIVSLERRLQEAQQAYRAICDAQSDVIKCLRDTQAERDAALREVEEHKRYAERYRWLRSKPKRSETSRKTAGDILVLQFQDRTISNALYLDALDAAIDAALAEKGKL